jgi:tetratricopeptide (TPR) repeat protein
LIPDTLLKQAQSQHAAGNLREAAALYENALVFAPRTPELLHVLGVLHTNMDEPQRAVDYLARAVGLSPNSSQIVNNLGIALHQSGRTEEAIRCFERALQLDPKNAGAAANLGNALYQTQDFVPAIRALEIALSLEPKLSEVRSNLGHCFLKSGDPEKAAEHFRTALKTNPQFRTALEGMAESMSALEQFGDAIPIRQKIVDLNPDDPAALVNLAGALQEMDRFDDAEQICMKALTIDPHHANAYAQMGRGRLQQGRLAEAKQSFLTACKEDSNSGYYRYLLASYEKVAVADGQIEEMESLLARATVLPDSELVDLHFALGKALSDVGEHARSFEHYLIANKIKRSLSGYREGPVLRRTRQTRALFTPDVLARLTGSGDPNVRPIFIVGLPRTGSTLIEQVLAVHSQTKTIGESSIVRNVVQALGIRKDALFPECTNALASSDVSSVASEYATRATRVLEDRGQLSGNSRAPRIIDKMPGNLYYLGLIHLAFPNAKIVYTRRDPIETCLSCFRVNFGKLNYTSDLAELGRCYREQELLMEWWQEILPKDLILEVRYENLVEDFDGHVRRILTHCGLDWEDACLSFQNSSAPVRTASAQQVRGPLYSSPSRPWRPSDDVLKPLLDALSGVS